MKMLVVSKFSGSVKISLGVILDKHWHWLQASVSSECNSLLWAILFYCWWTNWPTYYPYNWRKIPYKSQSGCRTIGIKLTVNMSRFIVNKYDSRNCNSLICLPDGAGLSLNIHLFQKTPLPGIIYRIHEWRIHLRPTCLPCLHLSSFSSHQLWSSLPPKLSS
jgi:hypothetical protein